MARSISQKVHLKQFRISHSTLKSKFAIGYSGDVETARLLVAARSIGHSAWLGGIESANHNGTDRRLAQVV